MASMASTWAGSSFARRSLSVVSPEKTTGGRCGRDGLALSQPEQSKAGLGVMPPFRGVPVGIRSRRVVPTHPEDLRLPVEGVPGGVPVRGVSQSFTCLLGLLERLRPLAM